LRPRDHNQTHSCITPEPKQAPSTKIVTPPITTQLRNGRDTAPRHTTKARVGSAATNNAAMPSSGRRSQWMATREESRVARVCVSMCQRKLHTPRPHTARTSHTTRTNTRSFCGRSVNADSWGRAASRRLRGALPTRLRAQCAANRRRQNQLAQRSHERNARHPQHGAPKHK